MRGKRLLAACLIAAVAGAVAGWLLRPGAVAGPGRPRAVEAVLAAVDGGDAAVLARALSDAGPSSAYASPWREEVELGRVVATGDFEAVFAYAGSGPPAAPRARALLHVREKAPDAALRERARRRLAEEYPASWAVRQGGAGGGR